MKTEKKMNDLTNDNKSEKGHEFFLGKMHFTGNNSYQNFLFFAPMLSSLMSDRNKKLTYNISPGISS